MAKKNINKQKTPINCKSFNDVCKMERDNIELPKNFWCLFDGYEITIAEQEMGHSPAQKISVSKSIFDKIVKWYITGSKMGKIKN